MKVFIAYSQEDYKIYNELKKHLKSIPDVELLSKDIILAGSNKRESLISMSNDADIIMVLLSIDLMINNSLWIDIVEKEHKKDTEKVIPILVRECLWQETFLGDIKPLPSNSRPIQSSYWRNELDLALQDITIGIKMKIDEINRQSITIHNNKINHSISGIIGGVENNKNISQDIDTQLDLIRKRDNKISETLKASPYDAESDLGGTLTELIFYKKLYVSTSSFNELSQKLRLRIDSIVEDNNVIFISGFPGNGKTTFLRKFINNNEDFNHKYIDLQSIVINRKRNKEEIRDEVIDLLGRQVIHEPDFLNTLFFIQKNSHLFLKHGFISKTTADYLFNKDFEQMDEYKLTDFAISLLDIFEYKDAYTFFFSGLFLKTNSNEKTIVYYDNLDVMSMEYVADSFLVNFETALMNANLLSRSAIFKEFLDFKSKFRFVFCLREANNARLNSHIRDRIKLKRVQFKLNIGSNYYKKIIEKRISFLREIISDDDLYRRDIDFKSLQIGFQRIVNDQYFKDVFIPMYNYDYRNTVDTLVYSLFKYQKEQNESLDYGTRGSLLFSLVRKIKFQNFLFSYSDEAPDPDEGYCLIDRMVLVVLLNKSKYRRRIDEFDESEDYGLFSLVRNLSPYYNVENILDSIAKCFLFHQKNWVHLLTIEEYKIQSRELFVSDFKKDIQDILEKPNKKKNEKKIIKLDEIKVKLNPSGFVYIKYLLPHFEFYSNLVGNESPLFFNALSFENNAYNFQNKIESVLKLVTKHTNSMRTFYRKKFHKSIESHDSFRKSTYCFKHIGRTTLPLREGLFHSTRIITSHIDYINRFRINLIKNLERDEMVKRINEIMIEYYSEYIDLLKGTNDSKVREKAAIFQLKLQKLKNNPYDRGEISINLNDTRM